MQPVEIRTVSVFDTMKKVFECRFLLQLLLCFCSLRFSSAIVNPKEFPTTKPPSRRESVLPWYLSGDLQPPPLPPDPSRPRQFTKSFTPWRKATGSQIEQRQELPPPPEFYPDDYYDQPKSTPGWNALITDDENPYEGIPSDTKKPHKAKLQGSRGSMDTIARYDQRTQVVKCPADDASGQFVYPPDCKFFVNCWNGRAFVQPCAPGTLFNPDTLECDFPHKVQCYSEELASADYTATRGPKKTPFVAAGLHLRPKEPRCLPYMTGLFPHPSDCTKFLQCANGGTFVMDCAPGTVFNPAISVCDWPYKVQGCEDALKTYEKPTTRRPPNHGGYYSKKKPAAQQAPQPPKPQCPEYHTGLLPHPETCRKFLQCANGITYVMDCGPGAVFNPANSVCDWPYNVPGCRDSDRPQTTTPATPSWTPRPHYPPENEGDWSGESLAQGKEDFPAAGGHWGPGGHAHHHGDQSGMGSDVRETYGRPNPHHHPNHWHPEVHPDQSHQDDDDDYGAQWSQWESRPGGQNTRGTWRPGEISGPVTRYPAPPPGRSHTKTSGPPPYPGHYSQHHHRHNHPYHQHQHQHQTPHYKVPKPGVPTNSAHQGNIYVGPDYKLPEGYPGKDRPPHPHPGTWSPSTGIHVNVGGVKGHFITRELEGEESRVSGQTVARESANRTYPHTYGTRRTSTNVFRPYLSRTTTEPAPTTTTSTPVPTTTTPPAIDIRGEFQESVTDPPGELPSVSIGVETRRRDKSFRADVDDEFEVDVLENKETWKPRLVFENKTERPDTSNVMSINKRKKVDVESVLKAFNLAPVEEEDPFPVHFAPPVQPLSHSRLEVQIPPHSGQVVRLRGGPSYREGYLEAQGALPGWGTVCDTRNGWTLKEAHVVCRQLGFARGAEMAWQGRKSASSAPEWIAADSVTCHGNETNFQACKFTHGPSCQVKRDAVGVRCLANRLAQCREDEVPYEGQCYHLADPESGLNHAEALDYCSQRTAKLLDVANQRENDFLSEWLALSYPEVFSVMTSGVGFTTFNRTLWLWEDSHRAKFSFAKWWPGWKEDKKHTPIVGSRPVCIVMKRKFPCHERPEAHCLADYYFWDVEDCAASMKGHSYVCKRPYDDIGCTYGKGQQYEGNASVTTSGKRCLAWADERIAHFLTVNVVDRQVREKLRKHSYCRNPNPNRENSPWCFVGTRGQYEACDIPSCGNYEVVSLSDGRRSPAYGQCKPKHFECLPGECIPAPWVCDGQEDCTNGADERTCQSQLHRFEAFPMQRLEGHDVEKWLNTPLDTCALRCTEADFTCRSFSHKAEGNECLLSDSNVGMTGALRANKDYAYYELTERSVKCEDLYVCANRKCVNQTQVCDGKNDCNDRSDESVCSVENLDYGIRLAGANASFEGRVEVKVFGKWGQVCDDGVGMISADVICKELGFPLGALEVRPGGFYGNLDPPGLFMVDQLKCKGDEKSLRECDFDGWGVHNCEPEEAVGVVCKTGAEACHDDQWRCSNSPTCIPSPFMCDNVVDCPDGSDESSTHCDAPFELRLANGSSPMEGRVEIRHHGVWGTVCDDDFTVPTPSVICSSLGYTGEAVAKKNGYFGPGEGPIWLDDIFCRGTEKQLYQCEHSDWGKHNCDHSEDVGVICSMGKPGDSEPPSAGRIPKILEQDISEILPSDCGRTLEDFDENDERMFARVVHGSVAPPGSYPWQASIRVRGHSRSNHWCGAVLLSPLHVLTAAHCLEGYNKGTYFVRAGDYNTEVNEGTEVEANIEDYYIHEDFRKGQRMNNDIALVLLKGRGIPLGKYAMPICLPPENIEYSPGLNCTISGFGSVETGKSGQSRDLRYGWVPLLDQSVCKAEYVYGEAAISEGMVCAGHLDEGVDTCDGDSGGPLACRHNGAFTLYGLTSWGQHCGKANKPGVYVRIAHYRHWIERKIKESLAGI